MEIEIKLAVPSEKRLEELHSLLTEPYELRIETVYYDTPQRDLYTRRWMLRTRRENERSIVTCKTPGDTPYTRGEWETEGSDAVGAIPVLIAQGAPAALASMLPLDPLCGARYVRHAALLTLDGCTAELALDHGEVFAGDRTAPICELELELKSGEPSALFALAASLSAQYGLSEEPRSKFARAASLCEE